MRIAVLGATGRTGRLIVEQAIERGYEARPVTRRRAAAADSTWAVADGRDVAAIEAALDGCDAVAFAIGPSGRGADPGVLSQSLAATLAAMPGARVKRIVVVTADGPFTGSGDPLTRFVAKPILNRVLAESMADFRAAERLLRDSTVDWTVIRPAQLTDKASRRYRSRRGASLWFGIRTSRAATAAAVLDALNDKDTVASTIAIAN
jgi:putative NADH-flavin reductase